MGHFAWIGWVDVKSYAFLVLVPIRPKLASGTVKIESGALDLPQDASINKWPHLFIDGAASINTWPHRFIDGCIDLQMEPHL